MVYVHEECKWDNVYLKRAGFLTYTVSQYPGWIYHGELPGESLIQKSLSDAFGFFYLSNNIG